MAETAEHTYVVAHEAWWWTRPNPGIHPDEIRVGRATGAIWNITFRNLGPSDLYGAELGISGRGFRALADRPDLFAALEREPRNSEDGLTLPAIRKVLDRLGFVDATPRVKPEREVADRG